MMKLAPFRREDDDDDDDAFIARMVKHPFVVRMMLVIPSVARMVMLSSRGW